MVVVGSGLWSSFQNTRKTITGQIITFRGSMLSLKHMIHIPGVYAVQRNQSEILVGSTVESAGFQKDVTAKGILHLASGILRINPAFGSLTLSQAWSGLRP